MKRFERMGKEEIIDIVCNAFDNCRTCPLCSDKGTCRWIGKTCGTRLHDYLTEEIKIKKVHRWELINSDDDLNNAQKKWDSYCKENDECKNCKECRYSNGNGLVPTTVCFTNFLKEEIEIEVEE